MRIRKWTVLPVAITASTIVGVVAGPSRSQPSPSSSNAHPVAVLDVFRIFTPDTVQIKDLNERMRQKAEDYSAELKQRGEALNVKKAELQAFRPGTADYESHRKEFLKMNAEAQAWAKATEEDLEQQKFDWTSEVYKQAIDAASRIAKDRGFDVVLQRTEFKPEEMQDRSVQNLQMMIKSRTVLYHVAEVDISEEVIRALNAAYRSKPNSGGSTAPSAPHAGMIPPKPIPSAGGTTTPPKSSTPRDGKK